MTSDESRPNHPELSADPEALVPAEQATLHRLLDVVTEKVSTRLELAGSWSAALHRPCEHVRVASVRRSRPGTHRKNPGQVGDVLVSESLGDAVERLYTKYVIFQTRDGLSIEKYRYTAKPDELTTQPGIGSASLPELIQQDRQRTLATEESQRVERELGLSFVAEGEACRLIAFLEPLEPLSSLS
jgi:hypothetical protein